MSEHGLQRWRKQLVFPILHKFAFRTGLLFGFGAMLALVVFVTYIGLRNLESIYRHTQFIVDNHVAKITLVTTMSSLAHDRIAIMQKMTLIDDPFDRDELTMYLDELASRFVMARTALMEMSLTSHEKLLLSEQGQRTGLALPVQRQINELLFQDHIEEAEIMLIDEAIPAQDHVMEKLIELYTYQQEAANQAAIDGGIIYSSTRTLMLWLSSGAILLGLIITTIVIRKTEKSRTDRERYLEESEQMNHTLKIQSSELEEATQRAQQANHFKSAFLANMSHEIRTPLTAIIGFSEVLKDNNTVAEEREYAGESISRNGKHLVQIINDVLDISKIEAGKLDVEIANVDLMGIVKEAESATGLAASNKGIDFKLYYDFPLPEVIITDATRLRQILINLINNAIKFTDNGSVSLLVSASLDHDFIYFTVSDTGIGMTEEQLGKVFNDFTQADVSTTRRYGGTGLGLSISQHLAKMLNGELCAVSKEGKGSRFKLKMKLEQPEGTKQLTCEPEDNTLVAHDSIEYEQRRINAPERISESGSVLLAEDNRDNQRLISLYIRELGAEVVIANNGKEAVELALAVDFDVVLMDMQMPIMDGVDATKMLRGTGSETPIVALTGNAMQQDVDRCMDAGCNAFLSKPIERAKFNDVVRTFIGSRDASCNNQVDIKASEELAEDGEYEILVAMFLEGLPQWITTVRIAIANYDWSALRAYLHDLKGMGGSFGYPEITHSSDVTRKLLHDGKTAEALDQMDALISMLNDILTRVDQQKNGPYQSSLTDDDLTHIHRANER